jgi:hypothetical protein
MRMIMLGGLTVAALMSATAAAQAYSCVARPPPPCRVNCPCSVSCPGHQGCYAINVSGTCTKGCAKAEEGGTTTMDAKGMSSVPLQDILKR